MYLVLNKKLITNMVNMRKPPIVTISTDTTNYDRVAYPFVSLYYKYFCTDLYYLLVLLG